MAVRWKFYPSENIPTNDSFYCFAVLSLDEKLAKGQNHGHKAKLIQTSNFFSNHCRSLHTTGKGSSIQTMVSKYQFQYTTTSKTLAPL